MKTGNERRRPISRTTLLKTGGALVGTAALLGRVPDALVAHGAPDVRDTQGDQIEPNAGNWKTWAIASGSAVVPPPPPGSANTTKEIAQLHALAAQRDTAALDLISYWDAGAPGYRWNEIAIAQQLGDVSTRAYRMHALLNIAIYDATIATWHAKYTYQRPRPHAVDATLKTALPTPASPSYPSEYAATAGAASAVLAYLFPKAGASLAAKAEEAGHARVLAGVEYPSDVAAGMALGRQVAARVIAWARADGSDAKWDGKEPVGPGLWTRSAPAEPLMGTWKTWVLSSGSQFRLPPPPAYNSAQRAAELAEVMNYHRDAHPFTELVFWPENPAGRPAPGSVAISSNQIVFYYAPLLHLIYLPELAQKLSEYRLDTNAPRAARAYALVSIAAYDATVAAWDGKFYYWTARPNQFDPTLTTVIPTYPMPDYPSGHATGLGATAPTLAYLFPRDAKFFLSRAAENAMSRVWAGIHFRSAVEGGLKLGQEVAQAVINRARGDGAG